MSSKRHRDNGDLRSIVSKAMGGVTMVDGGDREDEEGLYDDAVYDDPLNDDEFDDEDEYTDLNADEERQESPADSLFPDVIIGFMSMIMGEDSRQ
ncbi:MAG: hypothetical protein ACLFWB_10520 [Armatimonadota bacterium]